MDASTRRYVRSDLEESLEMKTLVENTADLRRTFSEICLMNLNRNLSSERLNCALAKTISTPASGIPHQLAVNSSTSSNTSEARRWIRVELQRACPIQ